MVVEGEIGGKVRGENGEGIVSVGRHSGGEFVDWGSRGGEVAGVRHL
jgi:hypothetical protein